MAMSLGPLQHLARNKLSCHTMLTGELLWIVATATAPSSCEQFIRDCGALGDVHSMMYMATRTQIYLTDEQRARLRERARATGVPMSQLIRDAVDSLLSQDDDLEATFESRPASVSASPNGPSGTGVAELLVDTDVCIDHLSGVKRLPAPAGSAIP